MPGLQLSLQDLKKELTNTLIRLKLVGNMNGQITLNLNGGVVCSIERKELFK